MQLCLNSLNHCMEFLTASQTIGTPRMSAVKVLSPFQNDDNYKLVKTNDYIFEINSFYEMFS